MGFRLAHIHDYNRFIAVDLGSYRVRTGIFEIDNGEVQLRGQSTIRQNRKNFLDGTITDLQWVAKTIERSIIEASVKVDILPEDIILSFSPEVTIFDTITTQYIRSERDAPITMEEIDAMIKKVEHESLERAKDRSRKQYGIIHDDIKLVSSTLTSIMIDSKRVTNPIGFTGGAIRIKVLNVFAPASEFNIVRSILSSLGKRTISVVPTPLLFPKIVERSDYAYENNGYLDIGHMHTTILIESQNEIQTFETFPFGTKMLLENLTQNYPEKTYLEIENILCQWEWDAKDDTVIRDFFEYVSDIILSVMTWEKEVYSIANLFLSGSLFTHEKYRSMFFDTFHTRYQNDITKLQLSALVPKKIAENGWPLLYWLALLAEELLVTKKDPVIRILRYVLYNYE